MSDSTRNDQVADLIAQRRKAARSAIVADPEPTTPAPLTSAQLGLWTRAALLGREADVNRPAVFRLKGSLDHDALAEALTLRLFALPPRVVAVGDAEVWKPGTILCQARAIELAQVVAHDGFGPAVECEMTDAEHEHV